MATFNGNKKAKLEANNRLSLPKHFFKAIDEDERNELLLTMETGSCILVYPRSRWDERLDRLADENFEENSGKLWKIRGLQQKMLPVKVDRLGRFYLPNNLKEKAGIDKEVTLLGMRTRIEIWPTDVLEEQIQKYAAK
ncbi:MAG TPA: hypothetical protein ENH29_03320 [Bacteroidetes bacterium]|nr:hypothetical protein [Bacteroidota bacterium]